MPVETRHLRHTRDMDSLTTAHRAPDRRLRLQLLGALAGLIAMALIITVTSSTTKSPPVSLHGKGAHRIGTSAPKRSSTTTIVPGAVTGAVTRSSAGSGCGLSLSGRVQPESNGHTRSGNSPSATSASTAPVGSCTVLEIGDSLGNDLGWGLSRHLAAKSGLNLVQLDKSSTGLSDVAFYDWPAQLASDLRQVHPKLVVVCLGGNDQQGIQLSGSAVQFPTAAWKSAYVARVRQLTREAVLSGAYVLWIGLPIMQPSSYSQGMQTLNALFQKGSTSEPNATFLSTWALFSNPEGAFQSNAEVNHVQTTVRQPDGIHLSFAGEDIIATYVIREMARIYHVRLTAIDPAAITGWN